MCVQRVFHDMEYDAEIYSKVKRGEIELDDFSVKGRHGRLPVVGCAVEQQSLMDDVNASPAPLEDSSRQQSQAQQSQRTQENIIRTEAEVGYREHAALHHSQQQQQQAPAPTQHPQPQEPSSAQQQAIARLQKRKLL